MPVRVANIWKHHRSEGEIRVYVGRACRGYPQSPLGNPYRASEGGRDQALTQYRAWLTEALQDARSPAAAEVIRLARLVAGGADLVLLCWCAPKDCHGDIVAEAVEKLAARMGPGGTVPA